MNNLNGLLHTAQHMIAQNSPAILTALGVGGVLATAVTAVAATPGALDDIAAAEENEVEHFTFWGKTKVAWKRYIPAAAIGAVTITCIVGSNTINARRTAAIASLYSLTDTAFKEYKEKVVETIGTNKEQKVKDAIVQDHLDKNPLSTKQIVFLGKGNQLCYDDYSGRYFKSDAETIRRAENQINNQLLNSMYASLNDFWNAIGLEDTKLGENLGWTSDHMMHLDFTSKLTDDGQACLVIDYLVLPKYDYFHGIDD